jgi:deoxyribodipyrimidine photolyase
MALVALNGCLRLKDNDLVSWVRASVTSGCIIPAIVTAAPSMSDACHQAWQDGFADALDADLEALGSHLVTVQQGRGDDLVPVSGSVGFRRVIWPVIRQRRRQRSP